MTLPCFKVMGVRNFNCKLFSDCYLMYIKRCVAATCIKNIMQHVLCDWFVFKGDERNYSSSF